MPTLRVTEFPKLKGRIFGVAAGRIVGNYPLPSNFLADIMLEIILLRHVSIMAQQTDRRPEYRQPDHKKPGAPGEYREH